MRAARLHGAEDLRIDQVDAPALAADEVRVQVAAGGICGSDLSYYHKGRVGDFALRQPLILGHEVAGEIVELGSHVDRLEIGMRVAIDPSRPCLTCPACRSGRSNLCRQMRFYGSAAVMPHIQGAFSDTVIARADQCHGLSPQLSWSMAALAEPLAVALHGIRRAGEVLGQNLLICGAGPIGCLLALAARKAGADHITITDLEDEPLAVARRLGVDETINVAHQGDRLEAYGANKGWFDLGLEATGAPTALASLLKAVRPGGRVVQIGMMPPGEIGVAANMLMAQEIDYVGAFRFHREFTDAVRALNDGRIDPTPIMSAELPLDRADDAFRLASDRRRAIKVHLRFS